MLRGHRQVGAPEAGLGEGPLTADDQGQGQEGVGLIPTLSSEVTNRQDKRQGGLHHLLPRPGQAGAWEGPA